MIESWIINITKRHPMDESWIIATTNGLLMIESWIINITKRHPMDESWIIDTTKPLLLSESRIIKSTKRLTDPEIIQTTKSASMIFLWNGSSQDFTIPIFLNHHHFDSLIHGGEVDLTFTDIHFSIIRSFDSDHGILLESLTKILKMYIRMSAAGSNGVGQTLLLHGQLLIQLFLLLSERFNIVFKSSCCIEFFFREFWNGDGSFPSDAFLAGFLDETHPLQHVGDVIDPSPLSLRDLQHFGSLLKIENTCGGALEKVHEPGGQ